MPPAISARLVAPQLATLACLLGLALWALGGAPYSEGAVVSLRAPAKAVHSEAFNTPGSCRWRWPAQPQRQPPPAARGCARACRLDRG